MTNNTEKKGYVSCIGISDETDTTYHPKIYIALDEKKDVMCPYCGKKFGANTN